MQYFPHKQPFPTFYSHLAPKAEYPLPFLFHIFTIPNSFSKIKMKGFRVKNTLTNQSYFHKKIETSYTLLL